MLKKIIEEKIKYFESLLEEIRSFTPPEHYKDAVNFYQGVIFGLKTIEVKIK